MATGHYTLVQPALGEQTGAIPSITTQLASHCRHYFLLTIVPESAFNEM